jgi:hypothetical protein
MRGWREGKEKSFSTSPHTPLPSYTSSSPPLPPLIHLSPTPPPPQPSLSTWSFASRYNWSNTALNSPPQYFRGRINGAANAANAKSGQGIKMKSEFRRINGTCKYVCVCTHQHLKVQTYVYVDGCVYINVVCVCVCVPAAAGVAPPKYISPFGRRSFSISSAYRV